jgi:hypothetical protein
VLCQSFDIQVKLHAPYNHSSVSMYHFFLLAA